MLGKQAVKVREEGSENEEVKPVRKVITVKK